MTRPSRRTQDEHLRNREGIFMARSELQNRIRSICFITTIGMSEIVFRTYFFRLILLLQKSCLVAIDLGETLQHIPQLCSEGYYRV